MKKQSDTRKISWTRGKCLGKGSFGTVSLAVKESDGAVFAVKSVDLATCLPSQLESLENEVRILRSLSSPYVVGYLGDDVTTSYRNLHMEFLPGGTVVDVASFKRRLADVDERILRWQTRCLVSGLKYVHGEGIVHCDVKGKNVLVGPDFTSVKLADFGSAIEMKKGSAGDGCRSLITPRGSPLWMAPEVIRGKYQGPESDVWSLGCTVIEMVTGKPAWEDRGFNSLRQIGYSEELPELPTQLSELGKDFVDKCLRRDPNQRWSCDQLLQHPFLASASAPNTTGESSPRCVLDFAISSDFEEDENTENFEASARQRIGKFATEAGVLWESDGWVAVRSYAPESVVNCEEGTSTEYPELTRTEKETEGTSLEFYHCFARTSSSSNSTVWLYRHKEEALGSKGSSNSLRCGGWRCRRCSAGPSCRCGSQEVELAVEKADLRFSTFCNLLQLFSCKSRKFSINFPKDKKVYVIGEDGILKELELAGFQYLGGPDDGGKKIELKPGFLMEHDKDVGAVVVGFDRYFNYYKVQYGTLCVRENPGCLLIATNRDAVTHLTDAQEWAGGGSMVGAICGSTQREPLVVGKPSTFMMDYLANKFGILKSQICMVGDRLDTDILFGQNGGCKTLLVLSGVTSLSMLQSPNNSIQPDFYTNKISDFLSLKAATV